jgi:hypothetical protein
MERIREGCARFPHWRSPIKGSMRQSRRRGESFTAMMQLDIRISTETRGHSLLGDASPYADMGRGDRMLFELLNSEPTTALNHCVQSSGFEYNDPTGEAQNIPSDQPTLVPHELEEFSGVYPDLGSTAPASFAPPAPLHGEYPAPVPAPGPSIPMATLDPRYLSNTDWYSGHNNV